LRAKSPHETDHSLDALLGPFHVLVGRAQEQHVRPDRVRAVPFDHLVRPRDVACALAHLRSARRHPAVDEEALERLTEADQVQIGQCFLEEARIDHVHGGVVDPAGVVVDRPPEVRDRGVVRRLRVVRIAVTQEVPRRVDERVHRLRLALPRAAAVRARHVHPLLGLR
jgi:hypothetical protein